MKYNNEHLTKLIRSVVQGSVNAFDVLYKDFSDFIYNVAFSILCNSEDANDIVQEVFIKLFNINEQNIPISNSVSWLYIMTKNEALQFIRKQKKCYNIDDFSDKLMEESFEGTVLSELNLYDCLKYLDARKREIVILKVVSGFNHKQIAEILNIPQGTVRWIYSQALKQLKNKFNKMSGDNIE